MKPFAVDRNGRVNGEALGVLADLLGNAFLPARFPIFLQYRLNRSLFNYAGMNDAYPVALYNVLQYANAETWLRDLVREARHSVPGDAGLAEFAENFELSAQPVDATAGTRLRGPQLELKIKASQSTFDVSPWRTRMGEVESRVCRIEYPKGEARGTGILIGPNAVLTNYHVVSPVIKGVHTPDQVFLRFDYKVQEDGIAVAPGVPYSLHADWLYHESPYSRFDLEVSPSAEADPDELDLAILKVNGMPGEDPVGGPTNDPAPTPRRWLEPMAGTHNFLAVPALYIVQHPDGKPMQVAIDSDAIRGVNTNGTRVRYSTTTQPGSSGSPCFGPNWEWVALHHSGDPKYHQMGLQPQYNEGVPLPAICTHLKKKGKDQVWGREI